MLFGIDTASVAGNKNPNWSACRLAGYTFAIIRAGYGAAKDTTFDRDWPKIKAAGMVRGAYLFWRPGLDPLEQATVFASTVNLEVGDLPPTIDVEFSRGRAATGLSVERCIGDLLQIKSYLEAIYQCRPILYTSARVWREDLNNIVIPELFDSPLWLTRYQFKGGQAPKRATTFTLDPPAIPAPWKSVGSNPGDNWWFHQFQPDAVAAPGFPTGNVDINRFNPLSIGSSGGRVAWLQRRLWNVIVDGVFGQHTEHAVRDFQYNHGLVEDGIVGPRTFAHLARIFHA